MDKLFFFSDFEQYFQISKGSDHKLKSVRLLIRTPQYQTWIQPIACYNHLVSFVVVNAF